MSVKGAVESVHYEPGDLVQVRSEENWSVVVLSTHRSSDEAEEVPDLGTDCCVPVALVRTPLIYDKVGPMRWVQIADLTSREHASVKGSPV